MFLFVLFFFFKQKTAYEMRISDWSSDVCSSDLPIVDFPRGTVVRVLALASQKGGSGKTTLSGHLAVQAQLSGAGPVVLIDIDPQGSLSDWWNERETDLPAFAQPTVARLASALEILRPQGFKLAVIDTPQAT